MDLQKDEIYMLFFISGILFYFLFDKLAKYIFSRKKIVLSQKDLLNQIMKLETDLSFYRIKSSICDVQKNLYKKIVEDKKKRN